MGLSRLPTAFLIDVFFQALPMIWDTGPPFGDSLLTFISCTLFLCYALSLVRISHIYLFLVGDQNDVRAGLLAGTGSPLPPVCGGALLSAGRALSFNFSANPRHT